MFLGKDTGDERNPANQLRLVVYAIIYRVFMHSRWCRISSINSEKTQGDGKDMNRSNGSEVKAFSSFFFLWDGQFS